MEGSRHAVTKTAPSPFVTTRVTLKSQYLLQVNCSVDLESDKRTWLSSIAGTAVLLLTPLGNLSRPDQVSGSHPPSTECFVRLFPAPNAAHQHFDISADASV